MDTDDHSCLMTIPEVALRLAVSQATVRRRIADGQLDVVRLGPPPNGPVRVAPADLDAWIQEQNHDRAVSA